MRGGNQVPGTPRCGFPSAVQISGGLGGNDTD
jgi:hypothetical protein